MLINHPTIKFNSKSISGYKKQILFRLLKFSILNNHQRESFYIVHEIFVSGYFKDLWLFFINFTIYHIHIFNPGLLRYIVNNYERYVKTEKEYKKLYKNSNIINIRNDGPTIKSIIFILRNILNSKKVLFSSILPPSYTFKSQNNNNIVMTGDPRYNYKAFHEVIDNRDYKELLTALNHFQKELEKLVHRRFKFKEELFDIKSRLFYWLGKIFNTGYQMINVTSNNYEINYNTEPNDDISKRFIPRVWHVILEAASNNYYILENIKYLYKITYNANKSLQVGNYKIMIIISLFYFIYDVNKTNSHLLVEPSNADKLLFIRFYKSMQRAINNNKKVSERADYIIINTKLDKKTKKVETKKVNIYKKTGNKIADKKIDVEINNHISQKLTEIEKIIIRNPKKTKAKKTAARKKNYKKYKREEYVEGEMVGDNSEPITVVSAKIDKINQILYHFEDYDDIERTNKILIEKQQSNNNAEIFKDIEVEDKLKSKNNNDGCTINFI